MKIISINTTLKHFEIRGFNFSDKYSGRVEFGFTLDKKQENEHLFILYAAAVFTGFESGKIIFAASVETDFRVEKNELSYDVLYFFIVKSHEEIQKLLDKETITLTNTKVDFPPLNKEEVENSLNEKIKF